MEMLIVETDILEMALEMDRHLWKRIPDKKKAQKHFVLCIYCTKFQ